MQGWKAVCDALPHPTYETYPKWRCSQGFAIEVWVCGDFLCEQCRQSIEKAWVHVRNQFHDLHLNHNWVLAVPQAWIPIQSLRSWKHVNILQCSQVEDCTQIDLTCSHSPTLPSYPAPCWPVGMLVDATALQSGLASLLPGSLSKSLRTMENLEDKNMTSNKLKSNKSFCNFCNRKILGRHLWLDIVDSLPSTFEKQYWNPSIINPWNRDTQ